MSNNLDVEIEKLQSNLQTIRRALGWSAEELGEKIGVTKQTVSNLENNKTDMSKTQYIAIRTVLDYEIANQPDNAALVSTVNLCLNSDSLSAEEIQKARAFVDGASRNGLSKSSLAIGLAALIGAVAAEALLIAFVPGDLKDPATSWLAKMLKGGK